MPTSSADIRTGIRVVCTRRRRWARLGAQAAAHKREFMFVVGVPPHQEAPQQTGIRACPRCGRWLRASQQGAPPIRVIRVRLGRHGSKCASGAYASGAWRRGPSALDPAASLGRARTLTTKLTRGLRSIARFTPLLGLFLGTSEVNWR
jgi:hypothetical protein